MHDNAYWVLHVNSRGAVEHMHAVELRVETKTMSTSTRCKVGRPATWAGCELGLKRNIL